VRVGGGSPTAKVAYVVASSTPAARIKCYALRDTRSVYADRMIYQNGLFFADAFSRVKGGLIWNQQFGWFWLSDFGCSEGIESLEIEFVEPAASATPKTAVIYPTRTGTSFPSSTLPPSPVPTITPAAGIVMFDAFACGDVTWLVWGASRVYLTVGTKREGVPGDSNGAPVHRDLCDSIGKKGRIDVFLPNGQQIYREFVVQ
jgi:hypothetical protein